MSCASQRNCGNRFAHAAQREAFPVFQAIGQPFLPPA